MTALHDLPRPPAGRTGWPWDVDIADPPDPTEAVAWPRIGIVTPSYNQGAFIEETIRSVLLQGYANLEFRVLDGGSTDETVDILRRYEPWLTSWSSGRDAGQSDAINNGVAQSEFRIGTWLNSDDVLLPGVLHAVGAHVVGNARCEFLSGDGIFVDRTGTRELFYKRSGAYSLIDLLHYGTDKYLPQPSVFFSRALFDRVGGLATGLHYAMDLDLWIRMRGEAALDYIAQPFSKLRYHDDAKTIRDNERAMLEVEQVILSHRERVSRRDLRSAQRAIRGVRARSACATALRAYFDGDRSAAWRGVLRAVQTYPPVCVGLPMRKVALRLLLPTRVRSLLFARP